MLAPSIARPAPAARILLDTFVDTASVVSAMDRDMPIPVLYPARLAANVTRFLSDFPGKAFFAVKANPDPAVIARIAHLGLTRFDVASIAEIDLVRSIAPHSEMAFMHPVKSRRAIRHAYQSGLRIFALDSADELDKILDATEAAQDLTLVLRLAAAGEGAALKLDHKFGLDFAEAPALLTDMANKSRRLGLSFHVGSQCLAPHAFRDAIAQARAVADQAGVEVDILDVGGGFPSPYPGMAPPDWQCYFDIIDQAVQDFGFLGTEIWGEPGRALVADAGSILAKVELRKGDALYLNDGTYGGLFDAGDLVRWRYPTSLVGRRSDAPLVNFRFYGPTCDSLDHMAGPFELPADMTEGDWIEIGGLGAYSGAMRTAFNGFSALPLVAIDGTPAQEQQTRA